MCAALPVKAKLLSLPLDGGVLPLPLPDGRSRGITGTGICVLTSKSRESRVSTRRDSLDGLEEGNAELRRES